MKLKEFGPPGEGARPKFYYVDPPLSYTHPWQEFSVIFFRFPHDQKGRISPCLRIGALSL